MATTLTDMPSTLTAGTTVIYTASRADYPATAGWALKLYLAGVSVTDAITGAASGAAYVFTLASATTAKLKPGLYQWQEIATKGTERYVAASGTVRVAQDIVAAGAGEMLTHEQRTLTVIEAAIEGRLTTDMESYSIAGRAVSKIPVTELYALRQQYKAAVDSQANPGRFMREVRMTFTGTSNET